MVWVSIYGHRRWSKKGGIKENKTPRECLESQDYVFFKLRQGLQKGEVIKLVEKRQPI